MTSIQVEEPITVLNPKMRIIMPSVGAEEPSLWDRVLLLKIRVPPITLKNIEESLAVGSEIWHPMMKARASLKRKSRQTRKTIALEVTYSRGLAYCISTNFL
jgi:hypothetical protein